ncbi:hypothetical protein OAO18_06140 [Francisellaceae bacterium]|nr:hypothetical protein [Francisellaceae bacterium]
MQFKKLILPSFGLVALSVVSIAYASSPIKLAQSGISATSVSKHENPVAKETVNILSALVSQKKLFSEFNLPEK